MLLKDNQLRNTYLIASPPHFCSFCMQSCMTKWFYGKEELLFLAIVRQLRKSRDSKSKQHASEVQSCVLKEYRQLAFSRI